MGGACVMLSIRFGILEGTAVSPENVVRTMWLVWWLSWWLAAALWSERTVERPSTRHQIVYRMFAAVGVVLLFGLYQHELRTEVILWHITTALAWTMAAVAFAGLGFTWWARIHLGRLWSSNVARKADHKVVDSGPYGVVRHPIYTGIILATAATAAMRGTLLAWLGVGVMTIGWIIKARMEEEFLRNQLGRQAYDDYASRVPMLAPLPGRRPRAFPRDGPC